MPTIRSKEVALMGNNTFTKLLFTGFVFLVVWGYAEFQVQKGLLMTEATLAHGAELRRDGVTVAEIWALREIGEDAVSIDLTTHQSADRYREFAQGLRNHKPMRVLGNAVGVTVENLVHDFNNATNQLWELHWPDGRVDQFCGLVMAVDDRGPLEEQRVFEALLQKTGDPSMEMTASYWHCISAPSAPGTPPPDDDDNWDPVDPPDEIDDGEAVFGCDQTGSWEVIDDSCAAVKCPFPTGDLENSTTDSGSTPMPDPISTAGDTSKAYSIFGVYEYDTLKLLSIRAFCRTTHGPATVGYNAAIYDSAGNKIAETGSKDVSSGGAWETFTFASPPILVEGNTYYLAIGSEDPAEIGYISLSSWEEPDGSEWDPDEDYEYCQTVIYEEETPYCP